MNVLEVKPHLDPGKPVCESTEGSSKLDNSYHIWDGIAHGDCWARFNGARLDYHNKYGMPLPEERADLYIT